MKIPRLAIPITWLLLPADMVIKYCVVHHSRVHVATNSCCAYYLYEGPLQVHDMISQQISWLLEFHRQVPQKCE